MALTRITEAQHQKHLMQWWAVAHNHYGLPELALSHVPNGEYRTLITGAKLKSMGMRRGFPDLQLLTPAPAPSTYGMLFLELKSEYGKVSQEQVEFLDYLRSRGYAACLCYGWDAARRCIENYLAGHEIPERLA